MKMLKRIRAVARNTFRPICWYWDTWRCRAKMEPRHILEIPSGMKMILMPHSDDEWIGCSQILMNQPENVLVVNMDMSGGDDEALHRIRRKEAEFTAQKYGYRFVTVKDHINELVRILRDVQPDCVFLPCYLDWHEEHIEVMRLFKKAAMESGYDKTVAMYQVSLPIPAGLINYGYKMSHRQLMEKWSALKQFYPSQSFLPMKRFMLNEYINGGVAEAYAIEAYSLMDSYTWMSSIDNLILESDIRERLKTHLQDIRFTREFLQELL